MNYDDIALREFADFFYTYTSEPPEELYTDDIDICPDCEQDYYSCVCDKESEAHES